MISPSLSAWHGSLGGRVHLSPFVSLYLPPVVSQPGCLARLSGWTGSFVYLCLPGCLAPLCFPSFVSRCLPAWMPGTFFLVDRFTFLHLSPFIWLLLSPSLDVCHGSPGGRIHLSPLVPLHLSPISVNGRIHLFPLCLPLFVSRCLPAWMPGTALWVDGFICFPLSPSLDVWHSRSAVSFTSPVLSFWRGLVCLRLWPWLWSFLVLWMLGTGSSSVCPSSGLRFRLGSCLFVQCLVISCGPELTIAVRCGARLQLREGSVNPPVKQT